MSLPVVRNPIRAFAVVCVAVTSVFVMVMSFRLLNTLSGPDWCRTAIGADKADANSKIDAAQSCVGLLTIQLNSLATNSFIFGGVIALCLLTLIVIVIAGGKLDLKVKDIVEANMSRDAPAAAQTVADAAQTTADQIKETTP
jgi:hypothetical protein